MRTITFEGRTISYPDDFSDAEISAILDTPPSSSTEFLKPSAYSGLGEHEPKLEPPTFTERVKGSLAKEAIPIGATAGGIIGGVLVPGAGALPGAAIGGYTAEQIRTRGKATPEEELRAISLATLMELGGQATSKAVDRFLAPFTESMTPIGRVILERTKGKALPAQVTEQRALDIMQNIAEYSLLGGGRIKTFKAAQEKIYKDGIDDVVRQFSAERRTPLEMGEAIQEELRAQTSQAQKAIAQRLEREKTRLIKEVQSDLTAGRVTLSEVEAKAQSALTKGGQALNRREQRIVDNLTRVKAITERKESEIMGQFGDIPEKEQVGGLLKSVINDNKLEVEKQAGIFYQQANELIGDAVSVDLLPVVKFAAQEAEKYPTPVKGIVKQTNALLESVSKMPERMTFEQAKNLRSTLLAARPEPGEPTNIYLGLVKRLSSMVDEQMGVAAKAHSPLAYSKWRLANTFYKGYDAVWRNDLITAVIKADPEKVTKEFLKPGNLTEIRNIKRTVDDTTWQKLQASFIDELRFKASPKGPLDADLLEKELFKYSRAERQLLFPKGEDGSLRYLAGALRDLEAAKTQVEEVTKLGIKERKGLEQIYEEATKAGQKEFETLQTSLARTQARGITDLERRYQMPAGSTLTQISKQIQRHDPAIVIERYFGPGKATSINKLWRLLSDDTREATQRQIIEGIVGQKDGSIVAKDVLKRLDKFGPDTLKIIFPGGQHAELRQLVKELNEIQGKQGEGTGRMWIQLVQPQAAASLTSAGVAFTGFYFGRPGLGAVAAAGSGAIVFGPEILARIFTNPKAIKWLTTGLQVPPGSKVAVEMAGRLSTWLTSEGLIPTQQE